MSSRSFQLQGLPATDYYAPGCRIEVEGKELSPAIIADVLQVTVTLQLDNIAQFNLNVNNWDSQNFAFKYTERRKTKNALDQEIEVGVFDLGHRVHVELGYAGEMTSMVRGVITTLSPRFPESGSPTIGISGLDSMFTLRDRKPSGREQKKWTKKRDSDIARDIAKRNNLVAHVDDSRLEHALVMQGADQDDATFLLRRAQVVDFDCYMGLEGEGAARRDTLFFVQPRDGRASGTRVFDFEWGKNLISFNPTLTLSRQVAKVTVRGWDSRNMEPIVASATAADLPRGRGPGQTASELVQDRLNAKEDVVVDANPQSKEEAKKLAVSLLAKRSYEFITGTMSVIGNPLLRPGDNVRISRLGHRFDGEYYITQAEHSFGAAGYLTQLSVRRIHDPGLLG